MTDAACLKLVNAPARHTVETALSMDHGCRAARQSIPQVSPGFDRVIPQPIAQAPTQFADMTFDDIFIDIMIEEAINRTEYLRFRHAPGTVGNQEFQDAQLAPRQFQYFALYEGFSPIAELDYPGVSARFGRTAAMNW